VKKMALRCFKNIVMFRVCCAHRANKASTAVEMAILTPVFLLLLVGITEIALVITAQQLLESASYNASRLAKTGYVNGAMTRPQTVLQVVTNQLSSFGTFFDTSKITTTSVSYSNFSDVGQANKGNAGYGSEKQIMVYTISYPWKLFTPMLGQIIGTWDSNASEWIMNLSTQIVVRNEPFG